MPRSRKTASIVVVGCLLAFVPGLAQAKLFSGNSEQGKLARVWTHPNGKVRGFSIRWRTHDCENGYVEATQTGFVTRHATADRFHDHRSFNVTQSDGARVHYVASVSGRLASPGRWQGRFKVKVHAVFDSATVDCNLGPISWSAHR